MAYRGLADPIGTGVGVGGDLDMLDNDSGMMESPLFSMRRIDFDLLDQSSVITHAQVSNSVLYVFTQGLNNDRKLHRKTIGDASSADFFDLKVDPIVKVFVSHSGSLVLFCTETAQTYFFSKQMKKYKSASKLLKDVQIQCVAFNRLTLAHTDNCVHFLAGTLKGEIYSVEYMNAEIVSAKQVFLMTNSFRSSDTIPVMSMEIINNGDELCVFCASKDRLHMFTGTITSGVFDLGVANVFRAYQDNVKKLSPLWFPDVNNFSQIHVLYQLQSLTPTKLYWLAGPGIIEFSLENQASEQMLKKYNVIPYPKETQSDVYSRPKACVLTKFHLLLLYDEPRSIHAVCPLNKKVMFHESLPNSANHSFSLSVCKDPLRDDQYLIFDRFITKYIALREDRFIWRIYLEQENFDWALKFAGTDNPNRLNEIYLKKAEYYFRMGKFDDSADLYARTKASFEEVALKFIAKDKMSLKNYLCTKLSTLKSSEKAQITMLVMWIIQLYLSHIHVADQSDQVLGGQAECQEEFHKFLKEPRLKDCLRNNMRVVYDLLGSHGDRESLNLVAGILEDYPTVIQNLVENEEYNEALDQLAQYKKARLFYKYSSVLMQQNPIKTVDVWKRMATNLQPKNLIPAIVQLDSNRKVAKQAINYLEFCLSDLKNSDTAIHNCLITLYAMHEPDKLLHYLETQNSQNAYPFYDPEYALRICLKHGNQKATIFLYKTMKLYEEAVDEALKINNKEEALLAAQEIASYAQEREEEPQAIKRLWLNIARYVVKDKKDVKAAMDFLRDNEHIKIEDILPFFPDFFTINEFKEAILTSLNEYNDSIERLKADMQNATESADKIRACIKENRSECCVIRADEKCSLCGYQLLLRAFYSFPCKHAFHFDCLLHRMKQELHDTPLLAEITRLERQIKVEVDQQRKRPPDAKFSNSNRTASAAAAVDAVTSSSDVDSKREELDSLVASECLFCGEIMIQSIHKPFIPPDRLEAELSSWL